MVRNLGKLVACAFSYIIPVIPHSLSTKLIEGEHFVLVDLCKSCPSGSSRAVAAQEDLAEAAWITRPQCPKASPQPGNKEQERKSTRQTKVVGARLEGFVDWVGVLASESAEEDEMSMLVAKFARQMRKRDTNLEDEATSIPDKKRPKPSSPDVEVEKD